MQDNPFAQFNEYDKEEQKQEKMGFEPFQKLLLHEYSRKI